MGTARHDVSPHDRVARRRPDSANSASASTRWRPTRPPRRSGPRWTIGYRHVDTATMYHNEQGVARGIRDAGCRPRRRLHHQQARQRRSRTRRCANGIRRDAGRAGDGLRRSLPDPLAASTRYGGDFVSTWRTLEEFAADGRARSIGVVQPSHGTARRPGDRSPPSSTPSRGVDFTNAEVRNCDTGITFEAWSPLARGTVLGDPVVTRVAEATGRSTAQVVLRWHLQRGDVVFPKSVTRNADRGQLRGVRLRAHRCRHGGDRRARRGEAGGSDPPRQRWTSSATADRFAHGRQGARSRWGTQGRGGNIVSKVPTIELNDGDQHPAAGLRRLPDRPRRDRRRGEDRARHRLPPHRHRRDVPERGRVSGRASATQASIARTCTSPASSTTASTNRTTPAARSTRRWRRSASTTSTCS